MPMITVMEATTDDVPAMLCVQKRAFESEARLYNVFDIPPLTETTAEVSLLFPLYTFFKAECEGRVVGAVRARVTDENACYVGRLCVEPAYQHRGIASRLMDAVEARFQNVFWYTLITGGKSDHNIRFYNRRGYLVYDTRYVPEEKVTFVFMRKRNRA